jgi:Mg-chelatase subunit ChlD
MIEVARAMLPVGRPARARTVLLPLFWGLAVAARAAPVHGGGPPPPGSEPLSDLPPRERAVLDRYLESPDWPVRVFGLLRLERYSGDQIAPIIRRNALDGAWPLRCFALRQALRLGVPLKGEDLTRPREAGAADPAGDGDDPRVIRAALRFGVELDEELVQRTGTRLLRTRTVDALLLGLEIAAASPVEPLRAAAAQRAQTLIANMDGAVEAVVSPRLAAALRVDPVPGDARQWRAWLASRGGRIELPPPTPDAGPPEPPLVAGLDAETFGRLLEYLDALRQRDLDMVLVMDSTASMIPMIDEARAGADSLIRFFNDISRTMRLALVAYRDRNNPPVCEGQPFTDDIEAVRRFLFGIRITGGPDLPEAVLDGLAACRRLNWREQAGRCIILIGDARPHDQDLAATLDLAGRYAAAGAVVHAVHVPMRSASDPQAPSTDREVVIQEHNRLTAAAFSDIAESGGGRLVTLEDAHELVPAILHATLEEGWWPVFDEFYHLYVDLCR